MLSVRFCGESRQCALMLLLHRKEKGRFTLHDFQGGAAFNDPNATLDSLGLIGSVVRVKKA